MLFVLSQLSAAERMHLAPYSGQGPEALRRADLDALEQYTTWASHACHPLLVRTTPLWFRKLLLALRAATPWGLHLRQLAGAHDAHDAAAVHVLRQQRRGYALAQCAGDSMGCGSMIRVRILMSGLRA